jgi:hypothetical protein
MNPLEVVIEIVGEPGSLVLLGLSDMSILSSYGLF